MPGLELGCSTPKNYFFFTCHSTTPSKLRNICHHHHHHHHISVMQFGYLLTRSGLTYPEVSSKVYSDSFSQSDSSVSLPWVIYFEAFYLNVLWFGSRKYTFRERGIFTIPVYKSNCRVKDRFSLV